MGLEPTLRKRTCFTDRFPYHSGFQPLLREFKVQVAGSMIRADAFAAKRKALNLYTDGGSRTLRKLILSQLRMPFRHIGL